MSDVFAIAAIVATPVICALFAGLIALNGRSGWGWFLFAAIMIGSSISIKTR